MTPNNHDDISGDLGRALHERADHIGAPLTFSDVKDRATRIRRRRAMATAAGVAAAVAIIVPTAIAGSDMLDNSSEPPATTSSPSPSPSETGDDSQSWPQSLDTSDLPLGEPPSVPWLEGDVLHGAGDLPLPAPPSGEVIRFDDGWMMATSASRGFRILILDASGAIEREIPVRSDEPFAASSDGTEVLYLDGEALTLHDNLTGEDQVITEGSNIEVKSVDGGVAFYNVGPWPYDGRRWDGQETDPSPGKNVPYTDAAAGNGLTIQLSSVNDFGSCSTLNSPEGEALGETCDFTLDEFSPDGGHILAGPAYRDGYGDGDLAVFPADGAAVEENQVTFHYGRSEDLDPFFLESAWEDADHVLVVTFTASGTSPKGTWQILRLGLDGSVENAVEPVEATDMAFPFGLS